MNHDQDEMAELLEIFQAESAEHILTISQGILQLEKDPHNREVLEEIFRSAHSLKGAARLMGLREIEEIAHRMEDILNATRKGEIQFQPQTADHLYRELDTIKAAVDRMLHKEGEEEPPPLATGEIVGRLEARTSDERAPSSPAPPDAVPSLPPPAPTPPTAPSVPPPVVSQRPPPATAPSSPALPDAGALAVGDVRSLTARDSSDRRTPDAVPAPVVVRAPALASHAAPSLGTALAPPAGRASLVAAVTVEETVRVTTKKLDTLMNQISELITNRNSAEQLGLEFMTTISDLEDWRREWATFKQFKSRIRQQLPEDSWQWIINWLERYHGRASEICERLQLLGRRLDSDVQQRVIALKELQDSVLQLRLLPLSTIFDQFHRLVRDLARQERKEINFLVEGAETQIDKRIIEEIKDPLIHLLRNCIDHGVEEPDKREAQGKERAGRLVLRAYQTGSNILIEVSDDGRGIDVNEVREAANRKGFVSASEAASLTEREIIDFIFLPGFSTTKLITDVSGRGVGMNVVKANIERLKGTIHIQSTKGQGALFRLRLPLTIATTYVMLFRLGSLLYAMPTSAIDQVLILEMSNIQQVEARSVIKVGERTLALTPLGELLGVPNTRADKDKTPAVILGAAEKQLALLIDEIIGDQEVVVRNFRYPLKRVRHLAGATILGDGSLALVLNPADLVRMAEREERGRMTPALPIRAQARERERSSRVLIVDDSITTRTLEKNILRSAGYEVAVAVDGQEALSLLAQSPFDIVVTDIEMPKVDGFQLTAALKSSEKYGHIPVILVTSLQSEVHRRKGLEVGADAYITKGTFDQNNLLETIKRLL